MPSTSEFKKMWEFGHLHLIVSMVVEELAAEGLTLTRVQAEDSVRRFYTGAPMADLSGPELLIRKWLADGMPE